MPAKLKFTYAECQLLARALNCCKPALHFDAAQQAGLPALGRKLAGYLAEPNYRTKPKPKKKLVGFALTRAPGSEWQQTRATLGCPFTEAAAKSPLD
ncbi:hypothetical protein GCM10027594_10980 [Hymenobacter agri]